GGWQVDIIGVRHTLVTVSIRSTDRTWLIAFLYDGTTTVTAYAECLQLARGATIAQRTLDATMGGEGTFFTPSHLDCPGATMVGGGFDSLFYPDMEVFQSFPNTTTSQWRGAVRNHVKTTGSIVFAVECLTYPGAHSSQTNTGTPATVG